MTDFTGCHSFLAQVYCPTVMVMKPEQTLKLSWSTSKSIHEDYEQACEASKVSNDQKPIVNLSFLGFVGGFLSLLFRDELFGLPVGPKNIWNFSNLKEREKLSHEMSTLNLFTIRKILKIS